MPSLTGVWRLLSGSSSASSSSSSSTLRRAGQRMPRIPSMRQVSALLTLGAIGVVYGDIGTSPLYALRECFHGMHGVAADATTTCSACCRSSSGR